MTAIPMDPVLAEAVRRWGPPIEIRQPNGDRRTVGDGEGRRIYLRALASAWGWPRIYLGWAESVPAGEDNWQRFIAVGAADRIEWAIADLKSLDVSTVEAVPAEGVVPA